jgi:hypothetical protein
MIMRKNFLLTTVILLLLASNSIAQNYAIQAKPIGSKTWGYINLNGDYILEPQYRKCYEFSESGYAPISDKKKGFYFIDTKGEILQTEIENFKLKQVFGFGTLGFKEGLVPVRINDKWGYLNTDGKLVIEAKYNNANAFSEGYAIVKLGADFLIIDKQGNETKVNVPNVKKVKSFSEQFAIYMNLAGLYGFINTKGEVVIDAQYVSVGYFKSGLAWAKTNVQTIGYINKNGDWVIKPLAMSVKDFDPETKLARIKQEDIRAYLKMNGEFLYFNDSEIISDFHDGLAKGRKNEKLGFFSSNMEWVIEPQFDQVRSFKNGYAAVKVGAKWGVINKQGNWVIEPSFAALKDVELIN